MTKVRAFAMAASLVAATALCATSAFAAKDDFNRSALGDKWKSRDGLLFINNNQLQGDDGAVGRFKKANDNTSATVTVILNGLDDQQGAITLGKIAGDNIAYVKLQQQETSGNFGYAAFYTDANGGGTFFALTSPVPSPATITVSQCGTVVKLTIKSAAPTQKYTHDYGTNFGPGAGLGTLGPIALDDFKTGPAACSSFSEASTVVRSSNAVDRSISK